MPNIPSLPDPFVSLPGVQMNAPPAEYIEQTISLLDAATASLGPNQKGILTWIAVMEGDKKFVNAAYVHRFEGKIDVDATIWIGKTWSQPIAVGVAGRIAF